MLPFSPKIFDDWQSSYEEFNYAFRQYCFMQFRAFNLTADFVPNVMNQIHTEWNKECERWLAEETGPDTHVLSHLKRASLLLHSLVSLQFLGNMKNHEYDEIPKVEFRGTSKEFESARTDLIDAREILLSLDFVLNIIHYFESNRVDRSTKFSIPLTADMRHDIIGYLLSDAVDAKAIYLILKALYLRPSSGGAAN